MKVNKNICKINLKELVLKRIKIRNVKKKEHK